jgi:hypothetical protein
MNNMSSSFPDNDTFQNHFNELISFFKPPDHISWSHVLVVEEQSISLGEVSLIPKSALLAPEAHEKRFLMAKSDGIYQV